MLNFFMKSGISSDAYISSTALLLFGADKVSPIIGMNYFGFSV